jgi:hypothetical protein
MDSFLTKLPKPVSLPVHSGTASLEVDSQPSDDPVSSQICSSPISAKLPDDKLEISAAEGWTHCSVQRIHGGDHPRFYAFNSKQMAQLHYELEIIERRLRTSGTVPPIDAIKVLSTDGLSDLTPEEARRKETYRDSQPQETLPRFWPARSWDNPSCVLSPESSDSLREQLNAFAAVPQPEHGNRPRRYEYPFLPPDQSQQAIRYPDSDYEFDTESIDLF